MNAHAPIPFVLGICVATGMASGQVTLTRSDQQAQAHAYYSAGSSQFGNFGLSTSSNGADYVGRESRSFAKDGYSGKGFAVIAATFTAPSPMLGGAFSSVVLDACTSAECFASRIGPHSLENSYGLAYGTIEFDLSAPMIWSWAGGWQGYSHNTNAFHRVAGEMTLVDTVSGVSYVNEFRTSVNGVGDWLEYFSRGGVLGPGSYRLTWGHESYLGGGNTPFGFFPTSEGGAPLVSCIPSTFTLTSVPAPGMGAVFALAGVAALRRRVR